MRTVAQKWIFNRMHMAIAVLLPVLLFDSFVLFALGKSTSWSAMLEITSVKIGLLALATTIASQYLSGLTPIHIFKNLLDFVLHLDVHLASLTNQYGVWIYLVLFSFIFAETGFVITPFLPGDSLLFTAGALAAVLSLQMIWLLLTFSAAAIVGDSVNYAIGAFVGPRAFTDRIPLLRREYLDRTAAFFEKYGGRTIILARFIPIIRTFAPFVAGIGAMAYTRFLLYNVIGGAAWVLLLTFSGYLFGNIPLVKQNFSLAVIAIIVLSLIPLAVEFWNAHRQAEAPPASEPK